MGKLSASARGVCVQCWILALSACDAGSNSSDRAAGTSCAKKPDAGNLFVATTPTEVATNLGRGINFGNMFDAPHNGDWNVRYDPSYVPLTKAGGFAHIRLPVRWTNHAALTEDAALDETFACTIEEVVDLALESDLYVVMDSHHYRQIDGDPVDPGELPVDASVLEPRLVNIWRQVAARFRGKSQRLVFELYNEPHQRLTPERWNPLLADILAAVRESDPERIVMVGGTDWYNASGLSTLVLPDDPNLIVTVHNYEPFQFTFQNSYIPGSAAWLGTTCCDASQADLLRQGLDVAAAFGRDHGYPVYLGEFGVSVAADAASRVSYLRLVRDEAEARGMPWAVWSLIEMGIYDGIRNEWRADLKNALLGP